MDQSNAEAGPSMHPEENFGPAHFHDIAAYPAANNPTQLTKDQIKDLYSEYHIHRGLYHLYKPEASDCIYHIPPEPEACGDGAIGISEAAFKCRFRVPLLKLVRRFFVQMNIAFSQMDSNGFIHINTF